MGLTELKLDDVANGILIVIIGLLSWLGINRGRKAKADDELPSATKPMEIAGALIDSRKADQLIEALDRHSQELDRNTEAIARHGKMISEAADNLREVNFEIRSMTKEIIRAR
jgi:hypothetical protein